GQGLLVAALLDDLEALGVGARILLTLNRVEDESFLAKPRKLAIEVLRNSSRKGFGANHNAALSRARTRFFVVMNPDVRLRRDPFPDLVAAALASPRSAIVAPRVLNPDGRVEDSVRRNLTPWSLIVRHLVGNRSPIGEGPDGEFRWFAGMFLLLDVEKVKALGGFDERFFLYCEDFDLCARAYLSGHTLLHVPDVSVVHAARRGSHGSVELLLHHLASLAKVWMAPSVWKIAAGAGRGRS
ncbi:MAG: glycosyltransferase, partial [Panacagrimonas sp.]